ncbi:neuropeptide Y receptor type 2-like [Actinia tenebrosa]|uniref:Neuropeptide Y receptor type 2-like n=1 Tax=Actinia tenebrosa TaxID=6105 RepID=A0A6P8INJ5_ACTTE|nr:neuropeptide Y receptor type 2-like [Actinia tenebrosa]
MAMVQEMTLLLIMVSGLLGNGLIIRVICGDVLMQTMGNKFAFIMAVSDLGLCVFFMPFSLISLFRYQWMFGQNMCHVTAFCGEFFTKVSTATLSVVVLEKHSNIVQRKLKKFSRNGVLMTFFVVCITALIFSVPYPPREAVYDDCLGNCIMITSSGASLESILTFVLLEGLLFKVVSVSLLLVSLLKVFKKIHMRRCMTHPRQKQNLINVDQLRMMAEDYTACTTLIVVASHVLLCLPYITIQLISIRPNIVIPHSWRIIAFWLLLFNTSLRPLIYGLRNRRSRNLMLQYFKRAKRNVITQNCFMKLGRRRKAYVVPVTAQQQTEQTNVEELMQIVDVMDIAASNTPLFTRRRIMTVPTINTTTEQTFLDLNFVPDESQIELQSVPNDRYEMMSLARRIESKDDDLCIQDIETQDSASD